MEFCRIDGRLLVHDEGEARRKCLNEQVTHHYHWPDKDRNSGWVLLNTTSSLSSAELEFWFKKKQEETDWEIAHGNP